jgi:hypothetical protein
MPDAETSASLSPSDNRAVVSGIHDGRHHRTAFRTPHARSHLAGHRPLHPARHPRTGSDADRERTNGTAGIRTSPIVTTMKTACRDAELPPLGPALRLGNQDRLGDGNRASATVTTSVTVKAAAWYCSTAQAAPRRTALLGRLRVERRANGEASSVMTSARADAGWFGRRQRWRSCRAVD